MVGAGPHADHRAAARQLGVAGELAGHLHRLRPVDPGDGLLPGRGVGRLGVVVVLGPLAGKAVAPHAVGGEHQVEDSGHRAPRDLDGGDSTPHLAAAGSVADVEAGEGDLDVPLGAIDQRQDRVDAVEPQVPPTLALLSVAEADRPVGDRRLTGGRVEEDRLPVGVLAPLAEVGGGQEPPGDADSVALLEFDEQR